ncbi:hypothetical protein [Bradyrhizobium sp.]|uniref:hypothetical protein n=1 Tax=Bradyrhizobium sp. TaxID=376 RepID=UPI0025BD7384|nr:hypothetical protein [Bradyrhizobium sp.]
MTTTLRSPRHRWSDRTTVVDGTVSGCQETHRRCPQCGLIKITVHPPHGLPWRVWRTAAGAAWQGDRTPPCVAAAAAEAS